jgi:flagellar motor protein MotB
MSMMKKKHEEGHEEGWIVSFADLMCLMMSFFVIMAAGNPKDVTMDPEFAEVVAAIKQAFNYLPPTDSSDPVDVQILMNQLKSQKGRGGTGKKGDAFQDNEGAVGRYDQITTVRQGTQITMGGQIGFDKDSVQLNDEADLKLRQIASRLKGHTNIFVIKGHTSKDEEQTLAGSNRDLAYERACAAADRLASLGMRRESLRAQSCHDYEPLKEGAYNQSELALNRRIEIIATESLLSEVRGPQGDTGQKKTPRIPTSQATAKAAASPEQPSQATARADLPGGH